MKSCLTCRNWPDNADNATDVASYCLSSLVACTHEPCKTCLQTRMNGGDAFTMYDKGPFINGKRADILDEAKNITSNGRKAGEYGKPEDSFQTIARFWSGYLDREIKPADVAVMMILLKVARIKSGTGKKDNWVDIAGYAACGGECEGVNE